MTEVSQPANAMRRAVTLSLRWKLVGLTVVSMATLALVLAWAFAAQSRSILLDDVRAQARSTGQALARNLANNLSTGDIVALQTTLDGIVQDSPDLAYVVVRDAAGKVIGDTKTASLKGVELDGLEQGPRLSSQKERESRIGAVAVFEVWLPVTQWYGDNHPLGSIQLAVRLDRISEQISAVVRRAVGIAAVVFVAASLAAFLLSRMMATPLERLSTAAAGMAAGDLRQEIRVSGRDELGVLASSFQIMAGEIRAMVAGLGDVARQLETEGHEIVGAASRQAAMATQQASAIAEASTTVAEFAQTAKVATEQADRVIEVAQRSEELSVQGKTKVEQVVSSMVGLGEQVKATVGIMNQLSQRAQQIGDVIATVRELAEQSNLLALNAAIEASRAGEHGRGFSVVALEMRNLAEQSRSAAGRVRTMLGEVEKWTREAVDATGRGEQQAQSSVQLARAAGDSIEGLAEAIRESSLAAKQIGANTRQQTQGVEQILEGIEQLSSAMSETVVGTKQIERGTESLSALSSALLQAVQKYKV